MAQTAGTGALTGTVTDSSGALIPNATVTATSIDTGQVRTDTTGADGTYKFSLLPPGTYKVRFAANGFKTVEIGSVQVNVTETPVMNRSLDVGTQNEQITVEANAEAVQTQSSAVGAVVNSPTITALPLSTRNYTNILSLSSGANGAVNNASALGRGGQELAVNGSTTSQNNYQMDGVSIISVDSGGAITESANWPTFAVPNPDTLAEFKIQTSLFDAGYGRNPGANVNVITKSGTNEFHGTMFEFFRNTDLNANDFFRNRSGGSILVLNQNQYGGVLGGPVKKDKLFFFGSWQGTKQVNGAASSGYASGIVLPAIPTGDRTTPQFQAALGAAFCNAPTFAGGTQIACDGSNINPVTLNLLRVKNADGSYFVPGSPTGAIQTGVVYSDPATDKENQFMGNADYILNSKNTIASRFYASTEPQALSFTASGPPDAPGTDLFRYYNLVLKDTSILTTSLVNEARASLQRNISNANADVAVTAAQIGMTPVNPGAPAGATVSMIPGMNITGAYSLGGSIFATEINHTNSYQLSDQISWTHGKHNVRAGGEIEKDQWNWLYAGLGRGTLTFQTFSDFLLGESAAQNGSPAGYSNVYSSSTAVRTAPNGIIHAYRESAGNFFVQDDYKVTRKLTLNLGVRWEYVPLMSDKYGAFTNLWTSQILSVPVPGSTAATGTRAGWVVPSNYQANVWGTLPAGVFEASTETGTLGPAPRDKFAPRFGFAYKPLDNKNFVVRGGYGFFYDRVPGNSLIHASEQSPPYAETLDASGVTNGFSTMAVPYSSTPLDYYPVRYANFSPSATGTAISSALSNPITSEFYAVPLTYQYNLTIQYEFLPRWVLEVGYVGSHAINQSDSVVLNQALLASPATPINGLTTNTTQNAQLRVPYLGFAPNGLSQASTTGQNKFNSVQATLRKQLSYGLTFSAAYTYARDFMTPAGTNDANNFLQQYGLSTGYRPQRLVISYTWTVPSGNLKGFAGKLASGWNVSGLTTIQDGTPMTVTDARGGSIFGNAEGSRAQLAPTITSYSQIVSPGGVEARLGGASGGPGYFTAGSFVTPPTLAGTNGTLYGDAGIGYILGPGQFNFDVTAAKTTRVGGIHENAALQFRAEFFNFFNHPQFSNPALAANAATLGQITSASVNPRLVQLALKYIF